MGQFASRRYLSDADKRRILAQWRNAKRGDLCTGIGGQGFPDPDVIPWCDEINMLDGVCTVQSCAGHLGGQGGIASCGHLWLAMDRKRSAAFDSKAFGLSAQAGIERVCRIYAPWGQEIACIEFEGNERGRLAQSMHMIVSFLRSLG